jgi:hypothetical protein
VSVRLYPERVVIVASQRVVASTPSPSIVTPSCAKTRLGPNVTRPHAPLALLDPRRFLGQASGMDRLSPPLAFFLLLFSGWVNRQQQAVIDYLLEENRVRHAVHGSRRRRLTDDHRRVSPSKVMRSAVGISRRSPAS